MKFRIALMVTISLICFPGYAQLQWTPYTGTIPSNAILGGMENGSPLWVCRTNYMGTFYSGKVVDGKCNIGIGGAEVISPDFDLLLNPGGVKLTWTFVSAGIPGNAVDAGQDDNGRIYVGQAMMANFSIHPGKIIGSDSAGFACHFGYAGQEVVEPINYQILTQSMPRLDWVAYNGYAGIPANAVVGGTSNSTNLQVCRATYDNGVHAGKVFARNCNISWGGKEIVLSSFEILVSEDMKLTWDDFNGSISPTAVLAATNNGQPVYIGQVQRTDGTVHCGKIIGQPGSYILSYGYGGSEVIVKWGFKVLVAH